ncbi:DEAD/DEAH box helicase [Oscillibacter ruminantium]
MTTTTFDQLSLSPELLTAVTEMGFTETTSIQAEAIPVIRTGADVLARSQTGTGKTVAFGIPAVECVDAETEGVQVLVLSPTRELAHQCGEEIRKLAKHLRYVRSADICGGSDYRDQFRNLRSANLVIGTPGRIMDHLRRGTLDLSGLKLVILDEADEMLNMGFREDIEVILQDVPEQRQIVLFSATLPREILTIAEQFQHEPVRIDVNHDQVTLDAIKQVYVDVPPKQKAEALLLLLHYYRPLRAIIFSNTKTMVDELAERLSAAGFSVEGLHGDMKQLQRTTVMNGFRKGRVSILVATDVAARGIDVSDIDYVVNFDIPKESDSYVHRIGRTGRAGRNGTALTLCCGRMQAIQLQRLAQRTKSEITQIDIPTVADIENANQQRTIQSIENAMQAEPAPFHTEMIEQLMQKGYAPERIAAALLGMRAVSSTEKLKDLTGNVKKVAVREHRAMAGVVFNIGSANRVSERHIVGAVTERAGLSSHDLGKIQISESFSSVTVPAEAVDDVIAAMRGCKICGKPVIAMPMPAAERTARKMSKPGARGAAVPYHGGKRKDRNGPKRGKPSGHRH